MNFIKLTQFILHFTNTYLSLFIKNVTMKHGTLIGRTDFQGILISEQAFPNH